MGKRVFLQLPDHDFDPSINGLGNPVLGIYKRSRFAQGGNNQNTRFDAFGQEEGLKAHAESDPEVLKALELLPQAKQLADNARRVVAERSTAARVSR